MTQLIISRKDALAQGLKFYFTGEPCSNGHLCERDVAEWRCLECRRAKANRKYQRNAGEINAKKRERYATDPEYRKAHIASAGEWGRANADHRSAYMREYRAANLEKLRSDGREKNAVRRQDPGIVAREREMSLAWKKANPEKRRSYVRNRRAILRNAEGTHGGEDIIALLNRQSFLCVYCEADLKGTGHHVDHIVPLSKGGSNWPNNLQCLCPDCNLRKWKLDEVDFLDRTSKRGA